ncbi:MAG: sigma-54 dependent transcriptional regulator [Desulfobulbaceae bacterium]|nr:sigma-54 dependent transcriptional regulator [Desulfobulbaceae bacterium]HIJ78326.1 sigma-54-dependent Fis family transcriptional regulator [Deltaproteobacteria bacterium]
MEKAKILIVDDEKIALRNLRHILVKDGHEVEMAESGAQAVKILKGMVADELDLVLTDLRMPGVDGMEILELSKSLFPDTEVVMITGYATVNSALEAMKSGAYHYVAKPYKLEEVRRVVREALEKRHLKLENRQLKNTLAKAHGATILSEDPKMKDLLRTARQIAQGDVSVLITGESGTGKELMSRFLHENSPRAKGPFLGVNCGVFTEDLLANELFGHEKGAFTGADSSKKGLIEAAQGGTLLLDEITEMSTAMQVKLLRVLQEKEVQPVGSTKPVKIDVRFIASTNRDILKMVRDGRFRQDLYFRVNVMNIHLPPLAERRRDIPLLVQFFINKFSRAMNKNIRQASPDAMTLLMGYDYPGNIRELENIIERAVVLAPGESIEPEHLPEMGIQTFRARKSTMPSLEEQERTYIEWVLEKTEGNRTKAAEILGIDRVSLWRKLKKYSME